MSKRRVKNTELQVSRRDLGSGLWTGVCDSEFCRQREHKIQQMEQMKSYIHFCITNKLKPSRAVRQCAMDPGQFSKIKSETLCGLEMWRATLTNPEADQRQI